MVWKYKTGAWLTLSFSLFGLSIIVFFRENVLLGFPFLYRDLLCAKTQTHTEKNGISNRKVSQSLDLHNIRHYRSLICIFKLPEAAERQDPRFIIIAFECPLSSFRIYHYSENTESTPFCNPPRHNSAEPCCDAGSVNKDCVFGKWLKRTKV